MRIKRKPYTRFKGKIAPVMDLDYDLSCSFHTRETLRLKFQMLADRGFKSVSIVVPPGNVDYTQAGRISFLPPEDNSENHLAESRAQFENPMKEAVAFAKQSGLRVNAIFKPYEGGGFFTIPVGHHLVPPRAQIACLGGGANVASFIADHPNWRLKRRDSVNDDSNLPVTSFEFSFLLDELKNPKYPGLADKDISSSAQWKAELYVSDDNARYVKIETSPAVIRKIKKIRIADPNNFTLMKSARCLIVTLSGFNITNKFMAVSFHGGSHRLLLNPHSMVKVKSGHRKLQATVSPTFRYQPSLTREFKKNPPIPADFKSCGFEFAETAPNDWRDWTVFGVARGREPYLRGSLCEAVPEVRGYWLDCIRTLIGYGCDGVDIRMLSHCSGISDFLNYGYNDELLEEFRNRFSRDPRCGRKDFLEIMRIRGDFFNNFLEDARNLLHSRGLTMQVHMRDCMCHPSLGTSYLENGFWAMPKILPDCAKVVELSDEIILSDNLCDDRVKGGRKRFSLPIKRLAARAGKKVWVYCYLQQGHSFNEKTLNDFARDPNVDGIHLYEVVYNKREDDGILEVVNPDEVRIVPKHKVLFEELLEHSALEVGRLRLNEKPMP